MRLFTVLVVVLPALVFASPQAPTAPPVRPGIDVLLSGPLPPALKAKRVGLITNHTGIDAKGVSTIDRLHKAEGLRLVALFAPEHGIRGTAADGDKIASVRDERTGLPIHSLYADTLKPTPAMLEGIDALLFDIQDVGARQYTYIWSMYYAMEAAAERKIPFVVLDRPNPIGGTIVEGNILDPAFSTFVGLKPIPIRYGLTIGELARFCNAEFKVGADLTVIPVAGWRRDQHFDALGLPWVNPSPNIRRFETTLHYPGTVLIEGTNLTEGRGTDLPFEHTGAPWLDAPAVAAEMNSMRLPGVRFEAVTIAVRPDGRKYPGQTIPGVRLSITDRSVYRPVRVTLLLIDAVRRRHPDRFEWVRTIDRLSGTDRVRSAVEKGTLPALLKEWDADAARFDQMRRPYLLY